MALDPVTLGPWPVGQDTYHTDVTHQAFQSGDRLASASDVDLDEMGNVERRDGVTERVVVTAGTTLFSGAGILLAQDGTALKKIDTSSWVASTLATLSSANRIFFVELAGKVFYTNGADHGIVTAAGTHTNWGMTVPPKPTLATAVGNLIAGTYRVSVELIDGNGVRSGAPEAEEIALNGSQDFTVDLSAVDANASYVRVYAGYTDTPGMWFCKQVAPGSLPVTITNVLDGTDNSDEPLKTQFLQGPPSGIDGLSSWGGYLLAWNGKYIIHSVGNFHHLFDFRTTPWKQPYDVQAVAGIDGGPCWVATTKGMVRYTGRPGSQEFQRKQMDTRAYAAGSSLIDGSKIQGLGDISGRVALFASEDGPAIGMPDGTLRHPRRNIERWTVSGTRTTSAYRERDTFNQIITTLE